MLAMVVTLPTMSGATCNRRVAVDRYPTGALQVRFVEASGYTDCLVASVVMCANYVAGHDRLDPDRVRGGLAAAGLDPTRIADVRGWLDQERLELTPLRGRLSDADGIGLGWWVLGRGYPVICVINKFAGNADYNHALVVIGFDGAGSADSASGVYLLDPASPKRLERWDRLTFEHYWASAGHVMLTLYETPGAQVGPHSTEGEGR
jgi:hypothetical protein